MEDSNSDDDEQICTEDEDENSVLLFSDKDNETKHLQQIPGMKLVTEQVDPAISSTEKHLDTNSPKPFDHVDQAISISLSDSSDSVNSLFKTQCSSKPVRNTRRQNTRTFLTKSEVRSQNGLDSERSSDSDEGLWRPSFLKIGEIRRLQRRKRSKSSSSHKKSGQPRGRSRSSITATEKRKRLRERGLEFPFVQKEYGKKDLPFKMIFAYEQAALCGLFDYMKELKCQKHLITSLKNINVDCTDRDNGPMRQYKYLDEKRPISPISESSDETCVEDLENEEAFGVKIVDNSCFIIEKKPEKKKKCRIMHSNGKNKNRSVNSGKNKYKNEANVKNKRGTVEQKNHAIQNLPLHVPFKQKTSEITKEKLVDQTTADPGSLQNTCRPLDEREDEGPKTTLSLKNRKSKKHSKRMMVQKREYIALQEESVPEIIDCELTMYQKVPCNGIARKNISQEQDDPVEQANKGTNLSSMLPQKKKYKLYNGNGYFTGSPL